MGDYQKPEFGWQKGDWWLGRLGNGHGGGDGLEDGVDVCQDPFKHGLLVCFVCVTSRRTDQTLARAMVLRSRPQIRVPQMIVATFQCHDNVDVCDTNESRACEI